MVGDDASERLFALNTLDSHAVALAVGDELVGFCRRDTHLEHSFGALELLPSLLFRYARFVEFEDDGVVGLMEERLPEASATKLRPVLKIDTVCCHNKKKIFIEDQRDSGDREQVQPLR